MKLILYSGGDTARNRRLHAALADLVPGRRGRRSLTYMPFTAEGSEVFYARFKRRYAAFGFQEFHSLAVDRPFSPDDLAKALHSDAIYLAGGNTFYFLHWLRKRRLLTTLRRYAQDGGVVVGLSAGAIIMTADIGLAGYPAYNRDSNNVGLKDWRSLGLVPFSFFPHYQPGTRLTASLAAYARDTKVPLFACEDGSGIITNGDEMHFVGNTTMFMNGVHGAVHS